jgi:hypothetical protein
MNKENVVYVSSGVLFNIKKNEMMSFSGKWMQLEISMLS